MIDVDRVRAWIESDPDPVTRKELESLVELGADNELQTRFSGPLVFGTAGIRGAVGAGPSRMNRAVVIRTTRGLADHLIRAYGDSDRAEIVVGFDARPSSRQFAEDTAGVLAAAGFEVRYFPEFAPTPLVAFAARHFAALAAVVVTASHNPPADNGYKVYANNAAQIIAPIDVQISQAIAGVGPANQVPRLEGVFSGSTDLVTRIDDQIVDAYWSEVDACRPDPRGSDLKVVYTPLHGVGLDLLTTCFQRAGHRGLIPVPQQAEPDGTFPTVEFPNPEEEGALDLAIGLAREREADLILANDPDADRLAVVVPDGGNWRPLTGNEIGVLLGDYLLRNHSGEETPIVINSIVSSPMLGFIAAASGARHEVTLTGFKWIANAGLQLEAEGKGVFLFGYEEALGFTVGRTVRDKDGVSAAVVFTDLVAGLAENGLSVLDRLAELWKKAGIWTSAQHSLVRPGIAPGVFAGAVAALASHPPSTIGRYQVKSVTDYRSDADKRPAWLGAQSLIELSLGDSGRVLVRPSGTEPKLKVYVDLSAACGKSPHSQHVQLTGEAVQLAEKVAGLVPL